MRYTPLDILKDEAQALFQLEQNMTKKIFDEKILSSTNQALVDEKSLYRSLEVMQESIFKPKEVRKLFADMDTQSDEENFQALDQFTDRLGNYINTITPVFTILKNAMDSNMQDSDSTMANVDIFVQKRINVLENEIKEIDERIEYLPEREKSDLSFMESDTQDYLSGAAICDRNEFAIKVTKTRFDFQVYLETEFEKVKKFVQDSLLEIDKDYDEANQICKDHGIDNLDLKQFNEVIFKYERAIEKSKKTYKKFSAMFYTLSYMLLNLLADTDDTDDFLKMCQLHQEITQELIEFLKNSLIEYGDYKDFSDLNEIIEDKENALYERLDCPKNERQLIKFKTMRKRLELNTEKDVKQDELDDLQQYISKSSNTQQPVNSVQNTLIQDFTASLEKMKERNKSLKQYVEKYI